MSNVNLDDDLVQAYFGKQQRKRAQGRGTTPVQSIATTPDGIPAQQIGNSPQPTYEPPDQHLYEKPRYGTAPVAPSNFLRNGLICATVTLFLILTVAAVVALLSYSGSSGSAPASPPLSPTLPEFAQLANLPPPPPANFQLQDLSERAQDIRIITFDFTTADVLQEPQRHPHVGGIPDFENLTRYRLRHFDVCCDTTQKIICRQGIGDGSFIRAQLERNPNVEGEVFLVLWINSKELTEVACWLDSEFIVN